MLLFFNVFVFFFFFFFLKCCFILVRYVLVDKRARLRLRDKMQELSNKVCDFSFVSRVCLFSFNLGSTLVCEFL